MLNCPERPGEAHNEVRRKPTGTRSSLSSFRNAALANHGIFRVHLLEKDDLALITLLLSVLESAAKIC